MSARPLLSIGIPTFNRAAHLENCLSSIAANRDALAGVELCLSDNGSTDSTPGVVSRFAAIIPIKVRRNAANLGFARNFLDVVGMTSGEFVWVIGDDDLLMAGGLAQVVALLRANPDTDFFFVNAQHLAADYVLSFPQPFDVTKVPGGLQPFSPRTQSGPIDFMELIRPEVTFDFLGGIFLSVFRRDKFLQHASVLDEGAIADLRKFSHFDNTFPQIKVFARAFARSQAYFHAAPVSVCLLGVREWGRMSAFLKSVRLVEAVEEYRRNGLPFLRYAYCRNSALQSFGPDFVRMVADRNGSGYRYINPLRLISSHLLYPNLYLSFVYPFFRKSFWRRWLLPTSGHQVGG